MKKLLLFSILVLFFGSASFFACSNNKEAESENETTETGIDKAVKETSRKILAPLEKARSVKNQQEERLRDMEEVVNEE